MRNPDERMLRLLDTLLNDIDGGRGAQTAGHAPT
jgi:hypothetical protein